MAAVALWAEATIPADAHVALHYGLDGQPSRFGDKSEAVFALWFMVGVGVFTAGVCAGLRQLEPRRANLDRSARTFEFVWIGALVLLLGVSVMMAASFTGAMKDTTSAARAVMGAVGVIVMVLGNAMGKVRPNFTLGVRTPWTLSSDIAWDKTHRLAGWLMVIWGLGLVLCAALAPLTVALAVASVGGLVLAGVSVAASYLFWRAAPDKRTA